MYSSAVIVVVTVEVVVVSVSTLPFQKFLDIRHITKIPRLYYKSQVTGKTILSNCKNGGRRMKTNQS